MAFGYSRRVVLADAALLFAVAAVLVGAHVLLSPGAKNALSFHHAGVRPHAMLTAAYVHVGLVHLAGNVGGFVAAAGMAYLVCLSMGRRGWFYATLPWLLVAVPVLANGASLLATRAWYPEVPVISRGFSAVVAGAGGFVFVALVALLERDRGRDAAVFVGGLVATLLLAIAYLRSVDALATPVLATLGVGGAVTGAGAALSLRDEEAGDRQATRLGGRAIPLLLIVVLLCSLVAGLFPTETAHGNYRTDVVAHGVGLLAGTAVAAATARW